MKSMLKNAWLLLHLKVTPNLNGDTSVSADSVDDTPEMLSPLSAQGGDNQVVSSTEYEVVFNDETLETASTPNLPEETPPINHSDAAPAIIIQNTTSLEALPTAVSSIETTSTQPTDAIPATIQAQDNSLFSSNAVSNTASAVSEAYTFAVIPKVAESPFYFDVRDGCEARATTLSRQSVRGSVSVKCLYAGPTDVDAAEQAQVVKDLISSGSVDGISKLSSKKASQPKSSAEQLLPTYPSSHLIATHHYLNEQHMSVRIIPLWARSSVCCS